MAQFDEYDEFDQFDQPDQFNQANTQPDDQPDQFYPFCWDVRDSMYAATLYNVYWSVHLAGFSHCSDKSSRQIQLSLSTPFLHHYHHHH
jgi:hypothetical protein